MEDTLQHLRWALRMNLAKSLFIGIYPMVMMAIVGVSSWQLALSHQILIWSGPLLTTVPFAIFLSMVMLLKNVARTSGSFPGLNALALVGVGLSGYGALMGGSALALGLAIVGALGFFIYSVWYSRLDRAPNAALQVGLTLPALTLKTADGGSLKTADLQGSPALIFFFRGNWCPLCMAQIKEVAARYKELSALGVRVLLISPQPHDNTIALAKRFEVDFEFLTDEDNRAARSLGLEAENGLPMGMQVLGYDSETVLPTVIVTDSGGIIRWLDQTDNYRIRPEPDTFLPLLRELATQ